MTAARIETVARTFYEAVTGKLWDADCDDITRGLWLADAREALAAADVVDPPLSALSRVEVIEHLGGRPLMARNIHGEVVQQHRLGRPVFVFPKEGNQ